MTHTDEPTTVDGQAPEGPGDSRPAKQPARTVAVVALCLAIVALVVAALLVPLFLVPAPVFLLGVLLAAAAGVIGLVLGIRGRTAGSPAPARRALVFAVVALVVDLALILVIVFGVAGSRPQRAQIELRAQGVGSTVLVTYASDEGTTTEEWPADGWKKFPTSGSSVELTVTAPAANVQSLVACQIFWDGTLVADESSESGTVTCSYAR